MSDAAKGEISKVEKTFLEELTINKLPSPIWAQKFVELGIKLSLLIDHNPSNEKYTFNLAISLPTRAYASTFINLGLQIGHREAIISSFDEMELFNRISKLPENSGVRYYETLLCNRNAKKLIYGGIEQESGKSAILLKDIKNPDKKQWISAKGCYRIILDEQTGITSLEKIQSFLERFDEQASLDNAISFTFNSSPLASIIGKNNIIEEENKLSLGLSKNDMKQCTINEITRLGSQTLLLSVLRNETCETLYEKQPPVVMYESLSSAIKYKDAYNPRVRIFIMDRQAPSIADYRCELKSFYLSREADPAPKIDISLPGVETISFYSAF